MQLKSQAPKNNREGGEMGIFQFEPTDIAEWRKLVIEGEMKAGFQLTELVENYVVITLNANTTNTQLSSAVIAIDLLKNIHIQSISNVHAVRSVGDQCLILAGLFPDRAKRKNVSAEYFRNLGENAYYVLSFAKSFQKFDHSLFYQLFENFSDLIRILKSMRLYADYKIFN